MKPVHSGLASSLEALQTLCRPVGPAVANVSLGRAVVAPDGASLLSPLNSPKIALQTLCRPVGHAVANVSLGRATLAGWMTRFLMTGSPNLRPQLSYRCPKRPSNGLPARARSGARRASAPASGLRPSTRRKT